MPIRTASAVWEGTIREGQGSMKMGSGAWEGKYSFGSRFDEDPGSNPEELIGAAHAGCFSMALAGALGRAGFPPRRISTSARVHINKLEEGFRITKVELRCEAEVPEIDDETFQEQAAGAKKNCPVSKALTGTDVVLDARLVS
jgi:osmotically inducible protein OsmC